MSGDDPRSVDELLLDSNFLTRSWTFSGARCRRCCEPSWPRSSKWPRSAGLWCSAMRAR